MQLSNLKPMMQRGTHWLEPVTAGNQASRTRHHVTWHWPVHWTLTNRAVATLRIGACPPSLANARANVLDDGIDRHVHAALHRKSAASVALHNAGAL